MNTSTCKKIGAGVVTLIAGSVLSLAADRADARTCLDAQGDGQCVVTPPTATPTPPHDCPIINGTSLCASDADLGLSGSGGTFVAGVYLPDIVKVDAPPEIYISPDGVWLGVARPSIVTGDPSAAVYVPDIVTGDPTAAVYIPDLVNGASTIEVYIPDIVKEVSVDTSPTDWVDSIGEGCVRAPWPQIVACPA